MEVSNVSLQFIDMKSGLLFENEYPYVDWFEGKQSTNIIYVKQIVAIISYTRPETSYDVNITIKIPRNDIFHVLKNPSEWDQKDVVTIDQCDYNDLSKYIIPNDDYYELPGIVVGVSNKRHTAVTNFFITASSSVAFEARQDVILNIEGHEQTFWIGADFYDEHEELSINISNNGVELPESIQKVIYDSNVHEEAKDNVLMNRKYKELLMDYMDILGTKGSYSSLINSLKWFGYGDAASIREFWQHDNAGVIDYEDHDISMVVSEYLKSMISKYSKTTYYGLYCACQKINGYLKETAKQTDKNCFLSEPIPALEAAAFRWTKDDMMIKMTLLGKYFKTYFMPIHLDLIHSTIEDITYTDALKIDQSDIKLSPESYIIQDQYVKCSIDNDEFVLHDVSAGADLSTTLVNKNEHNSWSYDIFGVKDASADGLLKYDKATDIIRRLESGDDSALLDADFLYSGKWPTVSRPSLNEITIRRDIAKKTIVYDAQRVVNSNGTTILSNSEDEDTTNEELKIISLNNYSGVGAIVPVEIIIPSSSIDVIYKEDICLTIDDNETTPLSFEHIIPAYVDNIYDTSVKYSLRFSFNVLCTKDGTYDMRMRFHSNSGQIYVKNVKFTVVDPSSSTIDLYKLIPKVAGTGIPTGCRDINDYMFSHHPVAAKTYYTQYLPLDNDDNLFEYCLKPLRRPITKQDIGDLIYISQEDVIVAIPHIRYTKTTIENWEWDFYNASTRTHNIIKNTDEGYASIKEPFIAPQSKSPLSKGYYDIKFRYRLSVDPGKIHELTLNGAFVVK